MKQGMVLGLLAAAMLAIGAGMAGAQAGGEATYKSKCLMCHGVTGTADTPAGKATKAKSFKDADAARMSTAMFISVIKAGAGKMPAYKDKLTETQIREVVAYIRQLK